MDAKLDSSVYTQTDSQWLPKWNAPYAQASNNGKPLMPMDVDYDSPGTKALISGTTTEEINKIINK